MKYENERKKELGAAKVRLACLIMVVINEFRAKRPPPLLLLLLLFFLVEIRNTAVGLTHTQLDELFHLFRATPLSF